MFKDVVSGPKGSLVAMLSSLPQCEAVVDYDWVLEKQGLRQIESLTFDKKSKHHERGIPNYFLDWCLLGNTYPAQAQVDSNERTLQWDCICFINISKLRLLDVQNWSTHVINSSVPEC